MYEMARLVWSVANCGHLRYNYFFNCHQGAPFSVLMRFINTFISNMDEMHFNEASGLKLYMWFQFIMAKTFLASTKVCSLSGVRNVLLASLEDIDET